MMKRIAKILSESGMSNIIGCIYLHKNKINGKCYVGQTINRPERRWQNGTGYSSCTKFNYAIKKYGWENFEHLILEDEIPIEQLNERELYWINKYDSFYNGYNSILPDKQVVYSPETIQRLRDSWTEERRLKQSQTLKTRWKDPNFLESFYNQDRITNHVDMSGKNNPMYGSHRTGKDAARKVAVICNETGDFFHTAKEAAEWLGSTSQKSHISDVCKGKRKSCGVHPVTKVKLTWRYATENEIKEHNYGSTF